MEFWITIAGLLRRKWVTIPAVLMAVALGSVAYVATPKTYVSSTTMVLTTTEFGGTESGDPAAPKDLTNPLLNFTDSLRTTSAILIQAMNSKAVAAQLGVLKPTKLVVDDGRSNPELLGLDGPFVFISVRSTSPDETSTILEKAQAKTRETLSEWQNSLGAPRQTYVGLVDVVPPDLPEIDRSRAIKFGLIASIFGFMLSVGIVYLRQQRRDRRRARTGAEPYTADTAAPSQDHEEGLGERPTRLPIEGPPGDRTGAEQDVVSSPGWNHRSAVTATLERKREPAVTPAPVTGNVRPRNP
ncbi:MAG: hypothetical protein ABIR39_08045 [Nocardioides sp.]|uniref:hypothetical protein n=1 Tax=Nocardioides sp. TaxID=35761 RepID=UPI003263E08D